MTQVDEVVDNLNEIEENLLSIMKKVPLIAHPDESKISEIEERLAARVRGLRDDVEKLYKELEKTRKSDKEGIKKISKRVIEIFQQKKEIENEIKNLRSAVK